METLRKEKLYVVPDTKITWVLKRGRLSVIVPRNNEEEIKMPTFWGGCSWRDILSEHTLHATWDLQKIKWNRFDQMNSYLSTL